MKSQRLTRPAGPWLHLLVAAPEDACNALWRLERKTDLPLAARVVRGGKSRTVATLFDEASAALQFPYYFGENWDAFYDCLSDLSWLRAEAIVVFFANALHLLDLAPVAEMQRFLAVLTDAIASWNEPDPPKAPRPFHVILHATADDEAALNKRCQALGLSLHRLE